MGDWLPLREIEQLYGAVKLSPRPSYPDDEISIPPQSIQNPPQSNAGAPLFASPAADVAPIESSPFAGAHSGNGNALFGGGGGGGLEQVQAAPAAARRAGGRAQGADLFGNVSSAGAEEDVMTSAANAAMAANAASADDAKLTGQRNENSVLFSLSALTEGADDGKSSSRSGPSSSSSGGHGGSSNQTTATSDGSGLIDIRALSANMGDDDKKKSSGSRVDDIMNLSGGGAFGAALAAPILAPPPLEMTQDPGYGGQQQQKSSKALLFGIIGAGAFIAIAIVVAVLLLRPVAPGPVAGDKPDGTGTATTRCADEHRCLWRQHRNQHRADQHRRGERSEHAFCAGYRRGEQGDGHEARRQPRGRREHAEARWRCAGPPDDGRRGRPAEDARQAGVAR